MSAPDYEAVVRETYGTVEALVDELYKMRPRPKPKRRRSRPSRLAENPRRARYQVTSDARVRCGCGVYVYTERIDNGPPALPKVCWHCLEALPS